jgi:hypothetical protein
MEDPACEWNEVAPNLEDVFIHLMGTSTEPVDEIH